MQATELPFETYFADDLLHHAELKAGTSTQMVEDYVHAQIEAGLVHTIHVSERRAFRSCRLRWSWAYAEDLHSSESIRALEFGLAYHHAMEIFYDPITWHLDKSVLAEHAIAAFKRYTIQTRDRFRKMGSATDLLEADFEDRLTSGEAMLRHYFTEVAPVTDTFEPVKVEIAFEVPLLDPESKYILCKCQRCFERQTGRTNPNVLEYLFPDMWPGLPVTIGGRLDLLARDLETGELGVLDWKTAAALMQDNELDFLELDDQISTYLLAMHKLDIPARQFWYHEQRKASPDRPEPLTRKYKGRMYQASKDLATSLELYLETIQEGDPAGFAAGAYTEYLEWLETEGPRFYQRTTVRRNDQQLRATERHIYDEYVDMVTARIYPNPSRKQCSWCNFFTPCLSKQRGEPYQHALNTLYVKGGRELSNDMNQPKKDLPKREPGKAADKSSKGQEQGDASKENPK